MRGLTVIAARRDGLALAMEMAAASAALGAETRLFVTGSAINAVTAFAFDDLLTLEVKVVLCQSRAAAVGIDLLTLDSRIEGGGMVGLLQTLGDQNLVTF